MLCAETRFVSAPQMLRTPLLGQSQWLNRIEAQSSFLVSATIMNID
jgi:hypothetical protein